jgi:hypothetical protein
MPCILLRVNKQTLLVWCRLALGQALMTSNGGLDNFLHPVLCCMAHCLLLAVQVGMCDEPSLLILTGANNILCTK